MSFGEWLNTWCGFMTSVLLRRHDPTQCLHTCNAWPHLSNVMDSSKQSRDHVHPLKQDRSQWWSMFDGSQHNKSLQRQRPHTLLIWCHTVNDWTHYVASWRPYCLDIMIQPNGYTRATHDPIKVMLCLHRIRAGIMHTSEARRDWMMFNVWWFPTQEIITTTTTSYLTYMMSFSECYNDNDSILYLYDAIPWLIADIMWFHDVCIV